MRVIDRYIFLLFLRVFLICCICLSGIYIMGDFVENLNEFIDAGDQYGGLHKLLWDYYAGRIPWFVDAISRVAALIAGVFVAHLVAIALYAIVFYLMHTHFGLGSVAGAFEGSALDFFYFSITSYTTLGVGDVAPHGLLRIIAGVEALNGFVLIGWSASFTYLAMERFWEGRRRV